MGKKSVRINALINILKVRGLVSVKELASLLQVSEMTIRRDLKILQQNAIAENVDGIMVYNPAHAVMKIDKEYNLKQETVQKSKEKSDIGAFAASLIAPNDVIILDTGTTTVHIAEHLSPTDNLTVLCYNINILMELRRLPNINILLAGGQYHPNTQLFESPQGIDFIRSVRVQKVFISAAGIHQDLGITCLHSYEIPTKKAILASGLQKILVADSSKFGLVHSCYCCALSDIDVVVTDKGLSDAWIELLRSRSIELYLV